LTRPLHAGAVSSLLFAARPANAPSVYRDANSKDLTPILCAILVLGACSRGPAPPPPAASPSPPPPAAPVFGPVQIEMKHVRLHLDDRIVLDIDHLRGEMVSRVPSQPPIFDDPDSYALHVFTAEMGVDMPSLTALMNRYVLAYDGAPLKDVTVEIDEGALKQKGKMHKGVWLPFSMKATVSATPDGRLRLHTTKVSALGIPATGLLDLFGLKLDDLVQLEARRGVEIKDDDVILAPGRVLPPPRMDGRLTRAAIVDGALRQTFGAGDRAIAALTPPNRLARHYIYFSGAVMRFGKLTMTGSDLQLIDADERDAFDFYPARYQTQLVAGYSKNTPAQGLETYMPDFADLKPGTHLRPVIK
jgi:hypothetical protein